LRAFICIFFVLLVIINQPSFACDSGEQCIDANQWEVGLAVGLGGKSNPLVDGDNIPLILLPDIAWYGESAYFDNGELGWQWINTPHTAFVSYLNVDSERAFFSFLHPANIFSSNGSISISPEPGLGQPGREPEIKENLDVSLDEIARRNWAIMAGARWYFYLADSEFHLAIEQDISGVHKGQKVEASFHYPWQYLDWQINLQANLIWKSADLVDYYYGVSARDGVDKSQFYQAKAGFQPSISITVAKPINKQWHWLAKASYQRLHNGMTDSPLVNENKVYSLFFGAAYRF
jgi:MipA family protein